MSLYGALFELVLRRLDPERAHHLGMWVIRAIAVTGVGRLLHGATRPDPSLRVETMGLGFESPFGVAAGFDKNAVGIRGLWQLGFGHIEVGTVTARPQDGNPHPRLFRLPADRAVINRMGFNNAGAAAARARLARAVRRRHRPVIGVNIGKSRVVEVADAADDYRESARLLAPLADYLVVNVSSPNTPGLRGLQEIEQLRPLLAAVLDEAGETPVLVKIAPDVDDEGVRDIARLVTETGLAGVIATNTTIRRDGLATDAATVAAMGAGGLSGPPLAQRSLEVLRLLRAELPAESCIVSVGGVETAEDVRIRIEAGANLVQGYTAFLYRGPGWARNVTRALKLRSQSGV